MIRAWNHTIYLSIHSPVAGQNVNFDIIGNYLYGQSSPTCVGAPMTGHGHITGFNVKNNWVELDPTTTTASCWGIGFNNNLANQEAVYFRNSVFSGNVVINGGNQPLSISSCPGCVMKIILLCRIGQRTEQQQLSLEAQRHAGKMM